MTRAVTSAKPLSLAGLTRTNAQSSGNQSYNALDGRRYRFVYSAAELTAMGFAKGAINAVSFMLGTGIDWSAISRYPLYIGMSSQQSAQGILSSFPMQRTAYIPVFPSSDNTQQFVASSTPLTWDGASSLVFDVITNSSIAPNSFELSVLKTSREAIKAYPVQNKAMMFQRGDNITVPAKAFTSLSQEVTVMFWHYGSNNQPQNHNTFEARGPKGKRILNAHVPWGNKTIS